MNGSFPHEAMTTNNLMQPSYLAVVVVKYSEWGNFYDCDERGIKNILPRKREILNAVDNVNFRKNIRGLFFAVYPV